jgi:hypothetical protein
MTAWHDVRRSVAEYQPHTDRRLVIDTVGPNAPEPSQWWPTYLSQIHSSKYCHSSNNLGGRDLRLEY